jgi:hypothetical protein
MQWANARRVWNQYAYNVVNVNEDLTIPKMPASPSVLFPSGNRPFNAFLQQQTMIDRSGKPFWPIAEVVWETTPDVILRNDSILFTGCIKNVGQRALQSPIYITIYKNETINDSEHKIQLDTIERMVLPDSTLCFQIVFTNLGAHPDLTSVWISVNDNNGIYPFQMQCDVDGRYEIMKEFRFPKVRGTVFPFVYWEETDIDNAGFNSQFPISVQLKAVPSYSGAPNLLELNTFFTGPYVKTTHAVRYTNTTPLVPNTPKNGGALGEFTNYGELINFGILGKTHDPGTPAMLSSGEAPEVHEGTTIGYYEFTDVVPGNYILEIYRAGYMVRWAKITVNLTDTGQNQAPRELIPGYIITDDAPSFFKIDNVDANVLKGLMNKGIYYKMSGYDAKWDLNADGYIDSYDYFLLNKYLNFIHEHYWDTYYWVHSY